MTIDILRDAAADAVLPVGRLLRDAPRVLRAASPATSTTCGRRANLPDTPETRARHGRVHGQRPLARPRRRARCSTRSTTTGLARNTLVICTTDHGIAFPGAKATLTDRGIGVMLIMRGPGGFAGGKASDALVSHIDIFPTVCDLLGIDRTRTGCRAAR